MTSCNRPHFIIAGAARCGTTWLWHLADRHPAIAMARPLTPEPKFFVTDALFEQGIDYYAERWFAPLPEARVLGEKSTSYLEYPRAAHRIRALLPDVKMVFVLRDPVERAVSNWRWSRHNGQETEPLERALALEPEREAALGALSDYHPHPHAYFRRGLYARLLTPWRAAFARDQVLVLRFEDIVRTPAQVASALHGFLGVPIRPDDALDIPPVNGTGASDAIPADVRRVLSRRYAEPNQALYTLLGPDFCGWPEQERGS